MRAGEMIMTLASHGFIDRLPGTERSITLRLRRAQLPDLEEQQPRARPRRQTV